MNLQTATVIGFVCCAASLYGQTETVIRPDTTGKLVAEILEVKRQYDQAQLKNDGAWFRRMFAEGYVFILPDGEVVTKTQFVHDLDSRDIVWESVSAKDVKARIYGDTAVVTGQFVGKDSYKGKPLNENQLFTSVWVKRNGRWQAISEHGSNAIQK